MSVLASVLGFLSRSFSSSSVTKAAILDVIPVHKRLSASNEISYGISELYDQKNREICFLLWLCSSYKYFLGHYGRHICRHFETGVVRRGWNKNWTPFLSFATRKTLPKTPYSTIRESRGKFHSWVSFLAAILILRHSFGSDQVLSLIFEFYDPKNILNDTSLDVLQRF